MAEAAAQFFGGLLFPLRLGLCIRVDKNALGEVLGDFFSLTHLVALPRGQFSSAPHSGQMSRNWST
jgi:hypothetical protein